MLWTLRYLDLEPTPEHLQLLMERLACARWLERAVVTADPIAIVWSPLGRERMGLARKLILALAPRGFDPLAKPCGQLAGAWHEGRFIWATRELRWPLLPARQDLALRAIAASLELAPDGLPTPTYAVRQ